ncbi:hypothetical protein GE09DRAFT_1162395, partial [Coniochaeta sp. 2T2.1]
PATVGIIKDNPIGNGVDAFRASFNTACSDKRIPYTPDAPGQLDLEDVQNLALDLLSALQSLRASRLLRPGGSGKNLFSDMMECQKYMAETVESGLH